MICEVRDGDMCSVAGGLGRAVGGKWSPPGVHNPQAALRLLGCPAPPLTCSSHVFRNWQLGQLEPGGHCICLMLVARTGLCGQLLETSKSALPWPQHGRLFQA